MTLWGENLQARQRQDDAERGIRAGENEVLDFLGISKSSVAHKKLADVEGLDCEQENRTPMARNCDSVNSDSGEISLGTSPFPICGLPQ